MKNELLRIFNMSINLGHGKILNNIDFSIYEDEFHGIYGLSDSEKIVFSEALMGITKFSCDSFLFRGKRVKYEKSNIVNELAYLSEQSQLVNTFNIAENMFALVRRNPFSLYSASYGVKKTMAFFKKLNIGISPFQMPTDLSLAEQHIVLICKVILAGAKLIILDSISNSYKQTDLELITQFLKKLSGISIIYISNNYNPIFNLAERITVMHKGRVTRVLLKDEINFPRLLAFSSEKISYFDQNDRDNTLYKQEDSFHCNFNTKNIPIKIANQKGKILLVTEHNGNLIEQIINYLKFNKYSDMQIYGKHIGDYKQAVANGLYLIPRKCRFTSYYSCFDSYHNLSFYSLPRLSKFGIINKHLLKFVIGEWQASYDKNNTVNQYSWRLFNNLLHAIVIANAKILILENPATHLDLQARNKLFSLLTQFANSGVSIIILSEYTCAYLMLVDRIYFLKTNTELEITDTDKKNPTMIQKAIEQQFGI